MALAATAEDLGIAHSTLWMEHQAEVEKLIGLPEDCKLATIVLVGKQKGLAKVPKAQRRQEWSWLHRNQFGNKQ